jgi:hypothetical protein
MHRYKSSSFSLGTDSCVNAVRRFIARTANPSFVKTDVGTNRTRIEKGNTALGPTTENRIFCYRKKSSGLID